MFLLWTMYCTELFLFGYIRAAGLFRFTPVFPYSGKYDQILCRAAGMSRFRENMIRLHDFVIRIISCDVQITGIDDQILCRAAHMSKFRKNMIRLHDFVIRIFSCDVQITGIDDQILCRAAHMSKLRDMLIKFIHLQPTCPDSSKIWSDYTISWSEYLVVMSKLQESMIKFFVVQPTCPNSAKIWSE